MHKYTSFFQVTTIIILFLSPILLTAQIADRVFKNAKVYTTNNTFAEAIAMKDGDLIYVGSDVGVNMHIGVGTVVEDLAGRLVLPGFHDIHMHPLEAGSEVWGNCALDGMETDPWELAFQLSQCNPTINSNGWKIGYGHSIFALLDPSPVPNESPVDILDNYFPDHPTLVYEETSHSVWVNSAALEELGITATTPDPVGGHIIKDPDNGNEPTGILLDNAGDFALRAAFAANATIDAQNKAGLVNFSLPLLAENGITSICEGRTYWKRNYHTIWQSIKNDDDLTCRVVLAPWAYPEDDMNTLITSLQNLYDTGDDFLKTTQIKVYADGILINATAALHAPYTYSWDLPFDNGINYFNESRLTTLLTALEQEGFDFHIHAIGDRGITESLNAIEAARTENGDIGARHRVTHLEVVSNSDYNRFATLNVTADAQVTGDFTNPANWSDNDFLLGSQRTQNFIPIKSLYDAGARVTLSSDWDVSSVNPFVGIQNAVTRSPQELPSVEAAIQAYTIEAAYVMRQENKTGSLEVGKWADFIVTDKDVFSIPANQISTTKTLLTYVGGEEVYRSDAFTAALSVELLYFEVKNAGCAITLEWATGKEQNHDKFIIERSNDGKNFAPIHQLNSKGNSTEKTIYTFNDEKPLRTNYYRLRQVAVDGFAETSVVVGARKNCEKELDVQLYPNITQYLSLIQLTGGEEDTIEAQLVNAQEKVVKQFNIEHQNKISQNPLNVTFLPEGVYYLRLRSQKNQTQTTKTLLVVR